MAWLEQDPTTKHFKLRYRIGDRKGCKSLETRDPKRAEELVKQAEAKLLLIERGILEVPSDTDVGSFLISNGKPDEAEKRGVVGTASLEQVCTEYLQSIPHGALEANTLRTTRIHLNHVQRILGGKFDLARLTFGDLQRYVASRSSAKGERGKSVSPTTIKKELTTLGGVWTWATSMGYVTVAYPKRGLRFPKLSEKPPFQTWAEIEEQIARGESEELWDCLFLSVAEITDVLAYVRATARHPFIYPMFVFAAHTGVRRSEIVRSRRADFDFNSKTVLVREKKRTRGRHTFRRIPLSQQLVEVMQDWFSQHPGGPFTITQAANGESNGDGAGEQPTVDMATFHFRSTLRGSKWEKLPGWHVFRHSFASNCAARAIDQRMIDEWMGHQTEEMRRRYRHFFPDQKRRAIDSVFQSAADTQAV